MLTLSRSLTGAWIETSIREDASEYCGVAPLRGRGLKQGVVIPAEPTDSVAPLRGRGLKPRAPPRFPRRPCRSLTGAWIETSTGAAIGVSAAVAPLRGRGLKHFEGVLSENSPGSLPYGGVD